MVSWLFYLILGIHFHQEDATWQIDLLYIIKSELTEACMWKSNINLRRQSMLVADILQEKLHFY